MLSLLALGLALLVITMLSNQNEMLTRTLAEMRAVATANVRYEYPLSFDLPRGWIMTEGCTAVVDGEERSVDCGYNVVSIETPAELPVLDRTTVSPDATYVYLQNTVRLPLFGGIAPNEAVEDAYQSSDVAVITVAKVDGEDILTGSIEEVTDLGEGFYKATICDVVANPECQMYGQWVHEYYFFGETGTYRMSVTSTLSGGAETIEKIILSAHE